MTGWSEATCWTFEQVEIESIPSFVTHCRFTDLIPGEKHGVSEWQGDGEVAVQRDHAQCFNAGCHTEHISCCPELAHKVSKLPAVQQDVTGAKGHDNHSHDEVSNSEWGDEEVGDCLESLEPQNGCNHQHVTWSGEYID